MDIRTIRLSELSSKERYVLTQRSAVPEQSVRLAAEKIVAKIRSGGNRALTETGLQYGGSLKGGGFRVSDAVRISAAKKIPHKVLKSLEIARETISTVHSKQIPVEHSAEPTPGVSISRRWSPLRRVAAYVPGGGAAYPSSLLMAALPARLAGVSEIVVATPANANGKVPDVVLAAADLVGITEIYAMGGAQAIAALAYGTETIQRVDKIVGPGNAWVTAAKLSVLGDVAIDLPAGPSEALVVSDGTVDPRFVAADLICQAEHGSDTPVVLVTTDSNEIQRVLECIEAHLETLKRASLIAETLSNHGLVVVAENIESALDFADDFAPEHLSLLTAEAELHAESVVAAGSVFVGPWAPESAGDYATGANHILPTGGQARGYGPLGVEDFGSWRQVQSISQKGLAALEETITTLAAAEGFDAHGLAASIRFADLSEK